MHTAEKIGLRIAGLAVLVLLLAASLAAPAQEGFKRETYQATAMGQGTQFGRLYSVNIIIERYSTPEDQQILIQAFNENGNEGLVNALSKMSSKGRIAITGTLGYDINYVRSFPTATGRKIRIVADRPLRFGELWSQSRSTEYSLSVIELDISNVEGQSGGTLLPAAKFYVSKEGELTMEAYQNPWKLTNVLIR